MIGCPRRALILYLLCTALVAVSMIPSAAVNTKVHMFYYPWYGNPANDGYWIHWNENGHNPSANDLAAPYFPELGGYGSRDTSVIHRHMKWLQDAGVGVIALSWWGQGSYEDNRVQAILDLAVQYDIKVCFHHEPYGSRTALSTKNDVIYLVNKYGGHPAFFRDSSLGNRTFIYVFASTLTPDADWAAAWDSIRGTSHDSVVMADTSNRTKVLAGGWDGFYNYLPGIESSNWASHRSWAASRGLIFVPPVGPGYDDTQVRSPGFVIGRAGGQFYNSTWSTAVSAAVQRVAITSFNEWHEGTQIEPAIPKTISGRTYEDYLPDIPSSYIDKTASWAAVYDPSTSGKIQCEDYSGGTGAQSGIDYYDTTVGNSGQKYRSHNVDIEDCQEGGYNVGWIAPGEWLRYTGVQVASTGYHEIRVRASAWNNPERVKVCLGSLANPLLTLTIPVTGGFQNWRTVSGIVWLAAGVHTVYLYAETGDFNLNWFEIRPVIDKLPPQSFTLVTDPALWANGDVSVTFSATDDPGGSGIERYEGRINEGMWASSIVSPWIVSGTSLAPGQNQLWVRAYDYAGNSRLAARSIWFDNVSPNPFTPVPSQSRWTSGDISVSFSTIDDLSGVVRFEGRIGSAPFTVRTSPWTISAGSLAPGTHEITIRAYDAAGNHAEGTCHVHYAEEAANISVLKDLPDGAFRSLKGKTVTLAGGGFFYVQESDRSSGIKVISSAPVGVGDVVEIAGALGGSGGERYIDCGANPVFAIGQ